MRIKNIFVNLFLISGFILIVPSHAETIILKDGRTIEGKILKTTEEFIEVDLAGIPIAYYLDDIESIDGKRVFIPKLSATLTTRSPKDSRDIFKNASSAIVYITTKVKTQEENLGVGFIVHPKGVILTNYHLIQGAEEINVKLKNGTTYRVNSVIHYDANRNLCILKINGYKLPVIPLADSGEIRAGDKLYCIGNPLGSEYIFSDGLFSGIREFQNLKWIQFTVPISEVNSGGPLINSKGEAIGIVTFPAKEAQGLNFALAINEVRSFIGTKPKISMKDFLQEISLAEHYLIEGYRYCLHKDYNQAINNLQNALEINPNFVPAYSGLANIYCSYLDECQKAIPYLQKALEIDSKYILAYNDMGLVFYRLGQPYQALYYYDKVLKIDPNFALTYRNLGIVYHYLGKYQEAISFFERSIRLDPQDVYAYTGLGAVYVSLKQNYQALNCYKKAIQIDPHNASAYISLGTTYAKIGQTEEALSFLYKAIEVDSAYAPAYNTLGLLYADLGQYPQARESLKKAKELYQQKGNIQAIPAVEEELEKLPH
jgi:tetratricopeptide (TPR) repeat protein